MCETFNSRPHRVTRRPPVEMLVEERARLHRLPDQPYTLAFGESRTVGRTTPMVDHAWCQYSAPHELRGEEVWVREHGEDIVIVHVGAGGPVEVARHQRTTPGTPRVNPDHFPPQPAGPLNRIPVATTAEEADFLGIGMGAQLWLREAGRAGTVRVRAKMGHAVALSKLVGAESVNWALGHAAVTERFDDGDLESIVNHREATRSTECRSAGDSRSLQAGTAAWEGFGQ